jgi:hypothetical protein
VALHLRNAFSHPAKTVHLLLGRLMTVPRIVDGTGAVRPFHQGAVLFRDDSGRQVKAVEVRLSRSVPPEDSVLLRIAYAGVLVGYAETGSLYIQDHVSPEFTVIREDAYAFPRVGVAEWKVNREPPDEPFLFSVRVQVPTGLTVATGGTRVGMAASGAR